MGCKSVLDRLKSDLNLSWRSGQATILAVATAAGPVVAQPGADTSGGVDRLDAVHGELWQPVVVITGKILRLPASPPLMSCSPTGPIQTISVYANPCLWDTRYWSMAATQSALWTWCHCQPLNASKPCVMAPQP